MKKMTRTLTLVTAAVMGLSLLAGCGATVPVEEQAAGALLLNANSKIEMPVRSEKAASITREEAETAALQHLDLESADIREAEMDDGVYELEIVSGGAEHEVDVSAATGEVLKTETEQKPVKTESLTLEEAKTAALRYLGLASADIWEWELDHGVYELELVDSGMEYEVDVRASDGAVLDAEKERFDRD